MHNSALGDITNEMEDIEETENRILHVILCHTRDEEQGVENAERFLDDTAKADSILLSREFRKTDSMIQINGIDVEDRHDIMKHLKGFAKFLGIELRESDVRTAAFLYPFDPNLPPPLIVDFVTTEICQFWMSKYRYKTYSLTRIREITFIKYQD